ncbi:MAG: S41 family peptidase [Fimbriimonadales bacterium]
MRTCVLLALFVVAWPPLAQIGDIESKPIRGAAQPAISGDSSKIAFRYRGDIWFVSSNGGIATRLTDHVELDQRPVWSPDGKWIAFTSDRNGNNDIFAIPTAGGETKQITYSGGNETATDWSPDGDWIAFSGRRDTPWTGVFVVHVRSLQFRKIAEDYLGLAEPHFSPDGKSIVAQRDGFPWTRPRYFGSGAAELVTLDLATGNSESIIDNQKQILWPTFSPNGKMVYAVSYGDVTPSSSKINEHPGKFVDNANRTPNIWKFDLNGKGQRVTGFVGEQIRYPTMSKDGTLAYERGGKIYTSRDGKETEVPIIAHVDSKVNATERMVLTTGASEAEISPDGKTFALVVGSELWTVPVEKGKGRNKDDAERLTDYPGVDEDIVWSKDGKSIYFISDRNLNRRIYSIDVATKKVTPVWTGGDDAQTPTLSPDGIKLAFWAAGDKGGLYTWDTKGGTPTKILDQPGTHFFGTSAGEFAWSPDSNWIALTRRQPGGTWNVWVVPAAGGPAVNVTQRNVGHGALGWSADGKFLYFTSNAQGEGFFILPLNPEDEDPEEVELKYEKPKDAVKIDIDFTNIHLRSRKLFDQGAHANVVSDKESGKIYFLVSNNLWVADYDGKNAKQIVADIRSFTLSDDGKSAYGLHGGMPAKVKLDSNVSVADTAFRAELVQDANLVRKSAFTEFWRMYNRGFYDPNFHGRDWDSIRTRYEPLLEGVGHRKEFAELLNMVVGELEGSHTEVGSSPGGTQGGPSVSLPGFNFDYGWTGPGIRVKSLFDRAPGTYKKTEIKPGVYVMAINGVDVRLDENLWKVLHNQSGRDLKLLVNSQPSKAGAKEITYRAISPQAWGELHYSQWVEGNRTKVREATGGKVGYIHIRGMGGGDRQRFEEEFHEYKQGKEAMIIDVRFNGGGNISDSLVDVLERRSHGFYKPRDGFVELAPNDQMWDKPIVVLHNEDSFSNAEMFPYAMRERKLAKLVGMPTPGYVIWTWGGRLVDGTSIRMPMAGVYRLDGTPMENMGQQPDIKVPWSNEDYMSGKDPQLDRAILELKKG